MTTFRVDLPNLAEPHMKGPLVQTLLGAVGAQLDASAEQILAARLRAMVYAGGPSPSRQGAARLADGRLIECEPWVLPLHAEQRGVPIYSTASELSTRIHIARSLHRDQQHSTFRGLLLHHQAYFVGLGVVPTLRIVHRTAGGKCVWHTLDYVSSDPVEALAGYRIELGPSNWHFGGSGRSRFWFITYTKDASGIQVPTLGPAATYDDGIAEYDDGITVYDGLSYNVAADLVAMAQDHAAHSKLAGYILAHDLNDFDPQAAPATEGEAWTTLPADGNWLSPVYTSGPNIGLATRNPRASFLYDNG